MKLSTTNTKTEFKLIEYPIENERFSLSRYDDNYYNELFDKNEVKDHYLNVKRGFLEYSLVKRQIIDGVEQPFNPFPINIFKLFTEEDVLNENIEKDFSVCFADRFLAYSTISAGSKDEDGSNFCPFYLLGKLKDVDRRLDRGDHYFGDRKSESCVHVVNHTQNIYWFEELDQSQVVHGIEDLDLKPSYRPYKITKITVTDDGTAIFHSKSKSFKISFTKDEFVPFFANVSKNVQTGELVCAFSFSKLYDELKLTTFKEWEQTIYQGHWCD